MSFDTERFMEQALLGEAVMGVPVAASVFDLDRRYVAVNDAFCDLTLYHRVELTAIKGRNGACAGRGGSRCDRRRDTDARRGG